MLQHAYIHDTFMYAIYIDATYVHLTNFSSYSWNGVWLSRDPKAKHKLVDGTGGSDCDSCEVVQVQVEKVQWWCGEITLNILLPRNINETYCLYMFVYARLCS